MMMALLILAQPREPHLERHGRVRRAVASDLPAVVVDFTDGVVLTSLLSKKHVSRSSANGERCKESKRTLLTHFGSILSLEYAVLDAVCCDERRPR